MIPPQTTAIVIAAVQSKPVVNENGDIVSSKILPITIAFDHRALDMGVVVPFMQKLNEIFYSTKSILEQ